MYVIIIIITIIIIIIIIIYVGERGGEWGKQVGSMNEELLTSQRLL